MIPPAQALDRLAHGNARYAAGRSDISPDLTLARRDEVAASQKPFAVVLGCADSRVPPELLFDQSLGDLFVVRVAGNIPTPAVTGSVEFGVDALGARLVVVLGHTRCGAVGAALTAMDGEAGTEPSPALNAVLQPVTEAIRSVHDASDGRGAQRFDDAVIANVRAGVVALADAVGLDTDGDAERRVVGAVYSLDDGTVTFLGDA